MGVRVRGVIQLSKVLFGPAGYPSEARGNVKKVFEILSESGMNAFEYAAVHGLRTKEEKARLIGDLSREAGIAMSMHAAYYINLASNTPRIRKSSKQRLVKALKFAPLMNVKRIVFHAGTHGNRSREEAHVIIRDALRDVWNRAGESGKGAYLAPEIAGKISAYGSEEQIIRLCQEVDGCIPTIDWAHLYARSQGKVNDKDRYLKVITGFERELGDLFANNMHFHVSGITFTEKGEGAHRPLGRNWGPDILPLIEIVRENGYFPTFISESTNPLEGALYTKFLYEELER
ncbi:MAG: TIM barrel protein [Candidatus Thorarchaeota archaeon]